MAADKPHESRSQSASPTPASGGARAGSPEQMVVRAVEAATQAARSISDETRGPGAGASSRPVDLPDFALTGGDGAAAAGLGLLDDVTLRVKIELGRTQMYVEDVLRLNTNSVVELDKAAGDPVDIYVNDRHVARGEVLVLNENFCVRVSEIIQQVGE